MSLPFVSPGSNDDNEHPVRLRLKLFSMPHDCLRQSDMRNDYPESESSWMKFRKGVSW